ncbi:hypothetical protein BU24DRAFT_351539, partial [Aaosphaeria arxii CBS 175.79]
DGNWKPKPSLFLNTIPSERFPAEPNRYVLYVNYCCPWAHRTIIVRALKGLESIIQLVEADARDPVHGWMFSGKRGPERDPLYGAKYLKELYLKADWTYAGRITVPMLWDKTHETIVTNESSHILSLLIHAFDALLPPSPTPSLNPPHLAPEIQSLNTLIHTSINNGVYAAGFATTQPTYDAAISSLFTALDALEARLAAPGAGPYLLGSDITEPDVRLYTTLVRFDVVYYTLFRCNLKMVRLDYPELGKWLGRLYWGGGVWRDSTDFYAIKRGYATVAIGNGIVPAGPEPPIMPL